MTDYLKELQKPFKVNEIEWRVGATNSDKTKGIALPYITSRAIQKRLDETFGIFGWRNEFKEWKGSNQICGISILYEGQWITKWDGASDSNMDATKGGLSGAMKRAATQWGIGRYLYDIPNQWVKIKQIGAKGYKLDEIPKLPEWALPVSEVLKTPIWSDEENIIEIPENVQRCINSFKELNINISELECYLYKEAFTFDEKDIQTLKSIYLQIRNKQKTKDDFFELAGKNSTKNNRAKELEERLVKQ